MTTQKSTENRVRRKAALQGYKLCRSAKTGWFNQGSYRLLDPRWNFPLLGKRYDASLFKIERYLDHT